MSKQSPYRPHSIQECIPLAEKACKYFNDSPDPFHAVRNTELKLVNAGYLKLDRGEAFQGKIQAGGKYYYTLNQTTLVAFAIGPNYKPGNGFKIIGGHTDSPNLKVKPYSKRRGDSASSKCLQIGVECYGGGLWHTWFDRDLGLSGRVLVRSSSSSSSLEKVESRFIKINKPLARVSSLCIHLQTGEERAAFKVNKEQHLTPIVGSLLEEGVTQQLVGDDSETNGSLDPWTEGQEPLLLKLLAKELDIKVSQIADFELNLFDTQPATLGGIQSEFVYSARLDNLATCFVAIESLISHSSSDDFGNDGDVSLVILFDHEEIGSQSAQGAGSPVVEDALRRITSSLNSGEVCPDMHGMTIMKSFLLSVDQAHAIHPNYASKHEKNHAPKMNAGVTIKSNQNQRYTTNSITGFLMRELCRKAKIAPVQEFVVRNDCPCGSTIGPIISSRTGIRAVDAGMPQLSMHSCREVMGTVDLTNGFELFQAFFKYFREIDTCLVAN